MKYESIPSPNQIPHIELQFPVQGEVIPIDHGYGLYGALSRLVPEIHESSSNWLTVQRINGLHTGGPKLRLTDRSLLRLRMPADRVSVVLPLSGREFELDGNRMRLLIPSVRPLFPHPTLQSRIVVIKGFIEPESFVEALKRQTDALEIQGEFVLLFDAAGKPLRRTVRIQRYTVVGFTVGVTGLSDEDSLKLQIHGLGGKRRMGCGVFFADRSSVKIAGEALTTARA